MEFNAQSILLALFTGVVAGLAGYLGSYSKVKAEVRAATEDLRQTIHNLVETTRAVELEKARIAADASLASDKRKSVYAIAAASQSLIHSMCWLAWDARNRGTATKDACSLYNSEAHKLLPELFSQLAVLRLLDAELHLRTYLYASKLTELDVKFGEAIILSETSNEAGTSCLAQLYEESNKLQFDIDTFWQTA